jgi:hypothetical protein
MKEKIIWLISGILLTSFAALAIFALSQNNIKNDIPGKDTSEEGATTKSDSYATKSNATNESKVILEESDMDFAKVEHINGCNISRDEQQENKIKMLNSFKLNKLPTHYYSNATTKEIKYVQSKNDEKLLHILETYSEGNIKTHNLIRGDSEKIIIEDNKSFIDFETNQSWNNKDETLYSDLSTYREMFIKLIEQTSDELFYNCLVPFESYEHIGTNTEATNNGTRIFAPFGTHKLKFISEDKAFALLDTAQNFEVDSYYKDSAERHRASTSIKIDSIDYTVSYVFEVNNNKIIKEFVYMSDDNNNAHHIEINYYPEKLNPIDIMYKD